MVNEEFKLPDGSFFASDIQGYCEYIIKKHQRLTDNPSRRLYTNKKKKVLHLKLKQGIISNF